MISKFLWGVAIFMVLGAMGQPDMDSNKLMGWVALAVGVALIGFAVRDVEDKHGQ